MKQRTLVKSSLVDSNNQSNESQLAFNRLHKEISPGFHLIDIFSSCFSFYLANKKNASSLHNHFYALDAFVQDMPFNSGFIIAIIDTSIRNNITISISHVFLNCGELSKKIYYVVNVTITEAKLFAIKCTINQSCQFANTNKIIIIMDTIHVVKKIFDLLVHLYQLQAIKAVQYLMDFFNIDSNNTVEF